MSAEPCIRRKSRFASDAIAGGTFNTYTVPLGEQWTLNTLSGIMFPGLGSTCHIEFWVQGNAFLGSFTAGGPDPNPFTYLLMDVIVNETEVLTVFFQGMSTDAAQYYIGGYKTVPGSDYERA